MPKYKVTMTKIYESDIVVEAENKDAAIHIAIDSGLKDQFDDLVDERFDADEENDNAVR